VLNVYASRLDILPHIDFFCYVRFGKPFGAEQESTAKLSINLICSLFFTESCIDYFCILFAALHSLSFQRRKEEKLAGKCIASNMGNALQ
jgi:hypothetical protein